MPVIVSATPATFSTETSLGIHSLVDPSNFVPATSGGSYDYLNLPPYQFFPSVPWEPPDGLGYTRRRDIDVIFGNYRLFYSYYAQIGDGSGGLSMYGIPTTLLAADYNQFVNDWTFNGGGTPFTFNGQTYRTLGTSLPQYPDDAEVVDAGWYESTTGANNSNWVKNGVPPLTYGAVITAEFYRDVETNYITATKNTNHPCYIDLLSGYELDDRTIPSEPTIIAPITGIVTIGYYRENTLESLPDLRSIYWVSLNVEMVQDVSIKFPIKNCVLGTLYISDPEVESLITGVATLVSEYEYLFLFSNYLPDLFAQWQVLYDATNDNPTNALIFPQSIKLHKLAANNDVWNNQNLVSLDINFDSSHPMCMINLQRSYDWHIAPQNNNNGIGTVLMDSPRTIEIHTALDAEIYSTNTIDSTRKRITNLGYLIENLCRVNGIRLDDDGTIDLEKEKELYQPKTINNPTLGLPDANGKYNSYGMSCFGTIGMIIPHLPTTYGSNGKELKLFDVVHDNQQLALAILRQQDVSLSIQHGSEIRVNGLNGKVHCYPNQLALQLEMLQKLEKISYQTDKSLLVSTVMGTEVRELFSGIGIPVTQKFLPFKDPANSKKVISMPYFGHQKNKPSTAQLLTTVHVNLAVINGVLMPKKQPSSNVMNPFKRFIPEK